MFQFRFCTENVQNKIQDGCSSQTHTGYAVTMKSGNAQSERPVGMRHYIKNVKGSIMTLEI